MRAYDGDLTAHIGRLALQPVSYLNFEGLDIATTDVQSINLCGIETSYRVYNKSHHVQIRRCRFSMKDGDGVDGAGCEIFKGAQGEYWLIEDTELRVPDNGGFNKSGVAMDFVSVCYSTVRRLYAHDYNKVGVYWKGGSDFDVLEDSVIANGRTDYCPTNGISMGGDGSGLEYANPATPYGVDYMVVRNNIVRGTSKAGLLLSSANWGYVYNNLFADCANIVPICGSKGATAWGYVNCMTYPADGSQGNGLGPTHIRIFNNIFLDTAGIMTMAYLNQLGGATDLTTGNNCYWNAGLTIPAGNLAGVDPNHETGAVIADPHLSLSGTPTTRQGWVDYYRPTSASTAIRNTGSSTAGNAPYPGVIDDIEGNGRPQDGAWDIGPYEYPGTPSKPTANFTSGAATGSPPLTVDFQDSSSAGPTAWSWDFGDGGVSTLRNPSHTYMAMGYHTVSLTAGNAAGSDTATKENYVHVLPLIADFGVDTTWGSAPLTVTFSDYSSGGPTAWNWDFGDGSASTAQAPSHTYSATGLYTVSLTATNALGSNTCSKPGFLSVCEVKTYAPTDWRAHSASDAAHFLRPSCETVTGAVAPTAGTVANLAAKDGSYVQFPSTYDSTSKTYYCFVGAYLKTPYTPDQILAVHVDTTARSDNPNSPGEDWYMYAFPSQNCTPGDAWAFDWYVPNWGTDWRDMGKTFQVSSYPGLVSDTGEIMAVWWAGGTTAFNSQLDYVQYTLYVKPGGGTGPLADFSALPIVGSSPLPVAFTDASTNTPTAWSWSFGDGGTSTVQNPSHTYSALGQYTVTLTATNAQGSNTCAKPNYVSVMTSGVAPVADFTFSPDSGVSPLSVSFTDASTNGPAWWWWSFGDGATSTEQNPTHLYVTPGVYDVSLTVLNTYGADLITKTGCLTVAAPPAAADFIGTPVSGPAPLFVRFTDGTSNSPTSWSWDFGDGGTSTVQNPTHLYLVEGTYTVTLTATNAIGSGTKIKTNYLTVTPHGILLVPVTACTVYWTTPIVSGGLSDLQASDDKYLVIGNASDSVRSGSATFNWSTGRTPSEISHLKYELELHSNSEDTPYVWFEIGKADGSTLRYATTSVLPGLSDTWITWETDDIATYVSPTGAVWLKMCVCGNVPTAHDYQVFINTARVTLNLIALPPVAGFSGTPTSGQKPLTVNFTDATTHEPYAWSWDFGDGTTSNDQNPSHTYTRGGTFTVTLVAAGDGGEDTATKTAYITVTSFTDVPADNWAWKQIEALVNSGIAQGNGNGTYTPLSIVTRGQMAVYLARALCGGESKVPTAPATADFSDVPTTHWAFKYVAYVYSQNIAAGNGDGTYSPDGIVDRGQMSVFISRSIVTPTGEAGLASYTPPTTPTFPDVPTSLWTFKYVEYLHENHIVNGEGDGLYHPELDVTRDQMAVFITRAFALPQ